MVETTTCTTGPHLPASLVARSGLLTGSSPWTKSINRNEKGHFQVLFIKTTYGHSSLGLFYLSGMEASPRKALDLYTGNDGTSLSLYSWMAHGKEMAANQLNCPGLLREKEVRFRTHGNIRGGPCAFIGYWVISPSLYTAPWITACCPPNNFKLYIKVILQKKKWRCGAF